MVNDNNWVRLTPKLNAEHPMEPWTTTLAEYRHRPDNEYGLCHELRNVYEGRVLPSSAVDDAVYFTTAELGEIPIIKALANTARNQAQTLRNLAAGDLTGDARQIALNGAAQLDVAAAAFKESPDG